MSDGAVPLQTPAFEDRVAQSIAASVDRLFAMQRDDGSWLDTLPSSAVTTASAIIALHFADATGSARLIEAGAAWLRDTQGPDGGWGDAPGARATLNVTPSAVGALQLVAAGSSRDNVRRGMECIERLGGMEAVADRNRCKLFFNCQLHLALAGLYDEAEMRRMPIEIVLLPRKLRQKLSFTVPLMLSWGVMQIHTRRFGPVRRAINRRAEPRVLEYLDEIHEFQGSEGGYEESPLATSVVCLALARAGVRPDLVRRCTDYLKGTVRADGSWSVNRDLELSATTWVTQGLQDAGYGRDPRTQTTLKWIRRGQRDVRFGPTGCPPGGWGWSLPSGWPDTDDTADALINLAKFGLDRTDEQVASGVAWLLGMQNRNGSWSCFCPDSPVDLDAPCSAMTAHAVTALRLAGGLGAGDPPVTRALRWFEKAQRPDGSVRCLWYRSSTSGTGAVLEALGGLGLAESATARRCREWLVTHQHEAGGWGDGGDAPPSAEETAWALLGLLEGGAAERASIRRGVTWLIESQRPDGLWDPTLLGVYFLDLLYSDDLLAAGYALQALARYRQASGASDGGP